MSEGLQRHTHEVQGEVERADTIMVGGVRGGVRVRGVHRDE